MTHRTFFSRSFCGALMLVLASCGSPEPQPEATAAKDTAQAAPVTPSAPAIPVTPLDVLKHYNRAMKRGDSTAVNFATGKAAEAKSYPYLKTSATGFSIAYDEPTIVQDSATIGFRVTRGTAVTQHIASMAKVNGEWKVARIGGK